MPLKGEKKREYQRQWMAQRRAAYFADKACVKCGSTERLELDHIDPSAKATHAIWSWSKERQLEELAKCQVLCYSCHTEKTAADKRKMFEKHPDHGTIARYKKDCRCEPCKEALREYWRKRRSGLAI